MIEFHDVYKTSGASDVLWALLVEREDDQNVNISHKTLPSREKHEEFIASDPYYVWSLVSHEGRWIGYINVTRHNEIGIRLFIAERGNGYGRVVLQKLLDEFQPLPAKRGRRPGHFVANINPLNERSICLFSKLGFIHMQNTYGLIDAP